MATLTREPVDISLGRQHDTWITVEIREITGTLTLYGSTVDWGSNIADWQNNALTLIPSLQDPGGDFIWQGRTPDTTYYLAGIEDGVRIVTLSIRTAYAMPTGGVEILRTSDLLRCVWQDQTGGVGEHRLYIKDVGQPDSAYIHATTVPPGAAIDFTFPNLTGSGVQVGAAASDGADRLSRLDTVVSVYAPPPPAFVDGRTIMRWIGAA